MSRVGEAADTMDRGGRHGGQARVRLAPFGREDFARLTSWVDSLESTVQWAGPIFTWPLDERQLEAYLATARGHDAPARIWRAEDQSGAVVGHIELMGLGPGATSAVVARVMVDPARRGRRVGRAMVREALRVGFEELGLHRLELRVFDFNGAAISCYESLGMVREGLSREVYRVGASYWSTFTYSILEQEWRARRREEEPDAV